MFLNAVWGQITQKYEQFSTLNQFFADIQCFTVKPVLNLPSQFKDKELPEQILKYESTHSSPLRSLINNALVDLLLFSQLLQDKRGGKVPVFKTVQERSKRSWQWVCCELWFILLVLSKLLKCSGWAIRQMRIIRVREKADFRLDLAVVFLMTLLTLYMRFSNLQFEVSDSNPLSKWLMVFSEIICDLLRKWMQGSQSWQTWNLHLKNRLFPNFKGVIQMHHGGIFFQTVKN